MNLFCVYVTIYRGTVLPPFYIGSSSVERVKKGYRGSVASAEYKVIWRDEIRRNPHLFSTKIISYQPTRALASDREIQIQHQLSVHTNPLYINKNIGCKYFYNPGTWKHTEEWKAEASRQRKGRKHTEEWKLASSVRQKGKRLSSKTKTKISASKIGKKRKPFSDEHRAKMAAAQQVRRSLNRFKKNTA